MRILFTFLDRSLKYDCPTCGAACCKGKGLAMEAHGEAMRFAKLEPRLSMLLYPGHGRVLQTDSNDGCWFLAPDGMCSVETKHGYAEKPHTCRFFPFNRIFNVGGVRIVDFNSRICPLQDSPGQGQSWEGLQKQMDEEPEALLLRGTAEVPKNGEELRWDYHEELFRDAIAAHLDEPDYAAFAAFQEEVALALIKGEPQPQPRSEKVLARAEMLRKLLGRWRAHHGIADDPGLAQAARTAARQAALLTSSWRINVLLRQNAAPYNSEMQHIPKYILATAHLMEAALLARQRAPGLRAATEIFQGASPLVGMLAMWTRRARLRKKLKHAPPREVAPALDALLDELFKGKRPLGDIAETALASYPPLVRAMAFSAFANGDSEVEFA